MMYTVLDILTLTSVDGTELHPCLTLLGGCWSGLALARTHASRRMVWDVLYTHTAHVGSSRYYYCSKFA